MDVWHKSKVWMTRQLYHILCNSSLSPCCQMLLRGGAVIVFPFSFNAELYFLFFFQIHFLEISERAPKKRNSPHASSRTSTLLRVNWLWALTARLRLPQLRRFVVEASILAFIWMEPCGDGELNQIFMAAGEWKHQTQHASSQHMHKHTHSAVGKRRSLAAM